MIPSLRRLIVLAIFAGLHSVGAEYARGGDEHASAISPLKNGDEQSEKRQRDGDSPASTSTHKTDEPLEKTGPSVESLLLDPESLIPRFEPDDLDGGPDTGFTPPRWLDENDQFLNEGEPFAPGHDPYRERPGLPPGWFAGVDLFIVRPEIDSQIQNTNLGPGDPFRGTFTNPKQLPAGDLNWTVAPKFYAGYRRENGLGEIIASYRFLQASSGGTLLNFDTAGSGQFNTRTQAHVIDLVCAYSDRTDCLPWFLPTFRRYGYGLRAASWIFDTTANGRQTLEERAGNVFIGAGPVLTYDWVWTTAWPSLTFSGGFDAAGVGGFNYQRFSETAIVAGTVQTARGRTDGRGTATPILGVWGGWSWVPDWRHQALRVSAGYRWERWWNIPDVGGQNDLTMQGPYVRADFRW